jgi:hypothetical protein
MAKKHSSEAFYAFDDPPGGCGVFGASGDDKKAIGERGTLAGRRNKLSANVARSNLYNYLERSKIVPNGILAHHVFKYTL